MSNKIVSIIATHNARIRCLLDIFYKVEKEIRMKNCAILRLVVNQKGIQIEMIYGGELDPKENKAGRNYYIANEQEKTPASVIGEIVFQKQQFSLDKLKLTSDGDLFDLEYVFYVVRHGQGIHNLPYATHLVLDTDITTLGKQQANNAGRVLYNLMKKYDDYELNNTFASDLVRTRQTIIGLYQGIRSVDTKFKFPKTIIVLPCSHELPYSSKGNCDGQSSLLDARENAPKCSNNTFLPQNKISNPGSECNQVRLDNEKIVLDWSKYMVFNNNKMRGMNCSISNMIKIAMDIITTNKLSSESPNFEKYMNLQGRANSRFSDYGDDGNVNRISTSTNSNIQRIQSQGGKRKTRKHRKTRKTKGKKRNNRRRKTRR
jgi:broad specificity phosphatase PhoE